MNNIIAVLYILLIAHIMLLLFQYNVETIIYEIDYAIKGSL